ncbi:MAG: S8 family serine peptidase, partial [bacterium]
MRVEKNLVAGLLLAGVLLATLAPELMGAQNGWGDYKSEELVCRMQPGYAIEIVNDLFGTSVKGNLPQTNCFLLATPEGADPETLAVAIMELPEVLYCGANYYLDAAEPFQRSQPFLDQQVIGEFLLQAAADTLDLDAAQLLSDGSAVPVAVIDGGINLSHPEFSLKSGGIVSGWDYVDDDPEADDEAGGPGSGHGTFVAGVVRLTAPGAPIYAYRVLDTLGRGDGYTIAAALLRAVDDGCRVINLSLGMVGKNDALDDAMKYAEHLQVMVVAAAGNDSTESNYVFPFPAARNNCYAVAALDSTNRKADFSNFGLKVDGCAPGTEIYSPYLDTSYAWWSGTSFAAPFVSGLAALLLASDPALTPEQIKSIIAMTAVSIDADNPGLEGRRGCGLIDPVAALQYLQNYLCGDA